jgi:hypothetical protein
VKRLLAIAFLLAACGASGSVATVAPTSQPTVQGAPTPNDAARASTVQDSILLLYGDKPQPAWYKYLRLIKGRPDLVLDGASLFVGAKPNIPSKDALRMCADIAAAHFDDNAKDVGFTHVHIETAPDVYVADCRIPGY